MKSRFFFSAAVAMASFRALCVEGVLDYVLAAGESATISSAGEYEAMSISGNLTVTGGVTNNVDRTNRKIGWCDGRIAILPPGLVILVK